jgi:hypothetical protein
MKNIKSTKTILKKEEDNFGEKMEKKMWGKLKLNSQPAKK